MGWTGRRRDEDNVTFMECLGEVVDAATGEKKRCGHAVSVRMYSRNTNRECPKCGGHMVEGF